MREIDSYTKNLSESSGLDILLNPFSNKAGVIKISVYTNEEKQSVLMTLSSDLNISFELKANRNNNSSEDATGYKKCIIEIKYASLDELDKVACLFR
jgi:hypothetical protein